jgi:hypothetical protein
MHQWINDDDDDNWVVVLSMQSMRQLHDTTIEELLGGVFSVWFVPRYYKQDKPRV